MNNLKEKLDQMMGNTAKQEQNIQRGVQQYMRHRVPKKISYSWQIVSIQVLLVAVVFLVILNVSNESDTFITEENTVSEAQPIATMYDLPILSTIQDTQYIHRHLLSAAFVKDGITKNYYSVFERIGTYESSSEFYKVGDIVAFYKTTSQHNNELLPYRIVGLPGDTIRVTDGQVFINNRLYINETLGFSKKSQHKMVRDRQAETLQADQYYVISNTAGVDGVFIEDSVTDVRNLLGKVVGFISAEQAILLQEQYIWTETDVSTFRTKDYGPEQFLDLVLISNLTNTQIDEVFGSATIPLAYQPVLFSLTNYRTVTMVSETEATISYKIPGTVEKNIYMQKNPTLNIWSVKRFE